MTISTFPITWKKWEENGMAAGEVKNTHTHTHTHTHTLHYKTLEGDPPPTHTLHYKTLEGGTPPPPPTLHYKTLEGGPPNTQRHTLHYKNTCRTDTHTLHYKTLEGGTPTYVSRFGLAVKLRLVNRGTSVRIRFGSPFSSKVVVCGHCLVTLSITVTKH